jgi:hypothetical protein
MSKIWEWLNGNKTVIGALILAVLGTGIIGEHTLGYQLLFWLGGLLAGTGVIHKFAKPAKANS